MFGRVVDSLDESCSRCLRLLGCLCTDRLQWRLEGRTWCEDMICGNGVIWVAFGRVEVGCFEGWKIALVRVVRTF